MNFGTANKDVCVRPFFPSSLPCPLPLERPDTQAIVKEVFKGTPINVTVQSQRHLGAAIGSRQYAEEYVNDKVTNCISEITKLS